MFVFDDGRYVFSPVQQVEYRMQVLGISFPPFNNGVVVKFMRNNVVSIAFPRVERKEFKKLGWLGKWWNKRSGEGLLML